MRPVRIIAAVVIAKPFRGRAEDVRMIRKPQVIVGAEIQHLARPVRLRHQDLRTLRAQQSALGLVQAGGADRRELLVNDFFE